MPLTETQDAVQAKNPAPVSGATVDQTQSKSSGGQTVQPSQGEATQTGVFSGAEKYMDSDINAPKKAKEDLTNQGTAIVTDGNHLEFVDPNPNSSTSQNPSISRTDVENAHSDHKSHRQAKKVTSSVNDLPPLPDLSQNIDDADFLAWLRENNDMHHDLVNMKNVDPQVRKKYQQYMAELEFRNRKLSSGNGLIPPEVRSRTGSTVSSTSSSSNLSVDSNGQQRRRGPLKAVVHALHLDRSDRKKVKKEKELEAARLKEELDLEQWKERLRVQHERKLSRSAQQSDDAHLETDSGATGQPSDVTDSSLGHRSNKAVSLALLNPEFIEKKQKEDEVLQSGGDLAALAVPPAENEFASVSSERLAQLIEDDHLKEEAGIRRSPSQENLTADQIKITFHTADSLDRLDRAVGTRCSVPA